MISGNQNSILTIYTLLHTKSSARNTIRCSFSALDKIPKFDALFAFAVDLNEYSQSTLGKEGKQFILIIQAQYKFLNSLIQTQQSEHTGHSRSGHSKRPGQILLLLILASIQQLLIPQGLPNRIDIILHIQGFSRFFADTECGPLHPNLLINRKFIPN